MSCIKCGRFGHEADTCATVMTGRKGEHQGGIRTLDGVKDRCRLDDITGCWNWAHSVSGGRGKSVVPVAWFAPEQRLVSALRISYQLSRPRASLTGRMVWRKCCNNACVNPEHLHAGSRQEWGFWLSENKLRTSNQSLASRRKARISWGVKTTMELAQWARESSQPGVEVAHALDIGPTQVTRIRKFQIWAPCAPASSVFSWAAMAKVVGAK